MKFYNWEYSEESSPLAKSGIYILFRNKPITKIYKQDAKGILYIGETKNLRNRLKVVKNAAWKNHYQKKSDLMFNHSTLTFAVDIDKNNNLLPHKASIDGGILRKKDTLFLKYALTKAFKECEKKLLVGHIMLFGQLPPFNNKGPTLKHIWDILHDREWKNAIKFYNETIGSL